ncbi:MAG: nucleotidyltransferase family protein [Deltaproteobacteria bacterium]|nr:nucleotidyltransferase family protein [Deltaproteobacteria bacterium]
MHPFLKPGDRVIAEKVSPESLQVGDVAIIADSRECFVIHRLVKILPQKKGICKGDSRLESDPEPVELSVISGRVGAIVRNNRLIPVSTGFRSRMKRVYAWLSLRNLTIGALRLKTKNVLMRLFPMNELNDPGQEIRYINRALSGHLTLKTPHLDWKGLKERAYAEGVAGILYHRLKDTDIPPSTLSQLRRHYQSVVAQNLITLDTLDKLEHALGNERIEAMTLKGASLLEYAYPNLGMRIMSDLDIMVRPEQYERFISLLHRLGYEPDSMIPHYLHKGRSVIDVHIHALNTDRIANRAKLFPSGMEPVWANALPWKEGYRWIRRPDDVDNVLLLAQHLMKHSFSNLIWIFDIHMLVKNRDSTFWTSLQKRANHLAQTRPLSYALYLTKNLFEVGPPQNSWFNQFLGDLSRLERGMLGARINGQTFHRLGPLMALFCLPGFKARITFLWETLFPKKAVIEQEFYNLHRGKRLLFYPGRVFQIAALALKQFFLITGAFLRG